MTAFNFNIIRILQLPLLRRHQHFV
jgi:hypothetical protein